MKSGAKYVIVSFQIPEPPTPVRKYLKEGDNLFLAGHADQALLLYEQGEQRFPEKKIDFQKRQIEVYIRQGNQSAAKAKMNDILKENPNDPETRGLRASYLLDEGGDNDEVINELADVIRAKPENFVAHFNLGRAFLASNQYDLAEAQFKAAIYLRPDYRPALAGHVQIELRKADYQAALQDSDKMLRRKPDDAESKVLKSAALTGLKRYDEARTLIQEVLAADPQNAEAVKQQKLLGQLPN